MHPGLFLSFLQVFSHIIIVVVMATMNEIKLEWIKDMLYVHGDYVVDLLQDQIESKRLKKSGELLSSIDYQVSGSAGKPKLSLSFMGYGRAIEIQYFTKNSKRKAQPNTNELVWGMRANSQPKKNTRWYSKTVYGSLNRLIGMLMYEFTDLEIARMKAILENKINPIAK